MFLMTRPGAGQGLPNDHPYQADLYSWLQTIERADVEIPAGPIVWDMTYVDIDALADVFLATRGTATFDDSPRFTIRGEAKWFVLDDGQGAGIEGTGSVKMLRWANEAAYLYGLDIPTQRGATQGNPYFRHPAVCRRALVATAVDLMMLEEEHAKGQNTRSDYLGGTLNALAYAYFTCKEVIEAPARAAFEAGFDHMMDKLLAWGPRQVNTNMDTRAIAAVAYIYRASEEASIRDKALRVARRFMFGSENGTIDDLDRASAIYMKAGYVSEARGPETTYNGVSLYHVLEACAVTRGIEAWRFMVEPCLSMIDFKLYQYFHDPKTIGFYDGPAGYANRTGDSYVYDQQGFEFRDVAAADFHPEEKALARNLRWPDNTLLKKATELPEFVSYGLEALNRYFTGEATDGATPPDWEEDHWPPNHAYLPEPGWYGRLNALLGANDPRVQTPYERSGTFNRQFGEEFWGFKGDDGAQSFGFFVEHIPRQWPYDSFAGGSLQTFWTEKAGILILSKHDKAGDQPGSSEDTRVFSLIDRWGAHHVWGIDSEGYAFTSAAWNDVGAGVVNTSHVNDATPYVEYRTGFADARGWPEGVEDPDGLGIDTTRALLVTRFTAVPTGIRVDRTITSDGSLQIGQFWDTIPIFLRDCGPPFTNSGDDGLECHLADTAIEYWTGNTYAALTDEGVTTARVRLTRQFGAGPQYAYIVFEEARRVRLASEAWQGSYMSDNRLRNVHIDLLGSAGTVTMPQKTTVGYTISTTADLVPPPPTNDAPAIVLTAPADGTVFEAPADIRLTASASDGDGTVIRVDFFEGPMNLGSDSDGSDGWSVLKAAAPEGEYTFRAVATDDDGSETASTVIEVTVVEPQSTANEDGPNPSAFVLHQNYPNPFRDHTTFTIELPSLAHVDLSVYDLSGRQVSQLLSDLLPAGRHDVTWECRGLAGGIYLVRMESGGGVLYRRATLLK
jgi:hypothetical protein